MLNGALHQALSDPAFTENPSSASVRLVKALLLRVSRPLSSKQEEEKRFFSATDEGIKGFCQIVTVHLILILIILKTGIVLTIC